MSTLLLKSPNVTAAGIEVERTTLTEPPRLHRTKKGTLRISMRNASIRVTSDVREVVRLHQPPLVLVATAYDVFLLTADEFDQQVPAKHR